MQPITVAPTGPPAGITSLAASAQAKTNKWAEIEFSLSRQNSRQISIGVVEVFIGSNRVKSDLESRVKTGKLKPKAYFGFID